VDQRLLRDGSSAAVEGAGGGGSSSARFSSRLFFMERSRKRLADAGLMLARTRARIAQAGTTPLGAALGLCPVPSRGGCRGGRRDGGADNWKEIVSAVTALKSNWTGSLRARRCAAAHAVSLVIISRNPIGDGIASASALAISIPNRFTKPGRP
jgi:hypothetical protein